MAFSRRMLLLGAAGGGLLALAGCGGAPSAAPATAAVATGSMEELAAAAKAERGLTLYTGMLQPDIDSMAEGFKAKYGLDLNVVRLGGADGMNRFDAESAGGGKTADIAIFADPAYFGAASKNGYTVPIKETGVLDLVPNYPSQYVIDDYETAILQIAIGGWAYNPQKVSADELPTSWEDVADSRWAGRLGAVPGDQNLNSLLTWQMVEKEYGDDFFDKVRPNVKRVYPTLVPMLEAVAAGEVDLALAAAEVMVLGMKAKGANIEFLRMSPTYYPTLTWGISTRAENPNSARLLAAHLMSEEGIATVNGPGAVSPYATDLIPADFTVATQEEVASANAKREKYGALK